MNILFKSLHISGLACLWVRCKKNVRAGHISHLCEFGTPNLELAGLMK